MYFAMDEIGFENEEKIKSISSESDRWQFMYDISKNYGFEGIHITPSLYTKLGLDLSNIPDYFQDFKLSLHLGGLHAIMSERDTEAFDNELENAFEIALRHNMHDISIHPPVNNDTGFSSDEKKICEEWFDKAIAKWVKEAVHLNISLSLETHVTGEFFLFDGLYEYTRFIDRHPDLGVLIDISHNYFDKFSEDDIINILGNKNIKGLHISDALQDVDFRKGTHLPVGDGTVDFVKLLDYFKEIPNLYGVLEIKSDNDGIGRSLRNLKNIIEK